MKTFCLCVLSWCWTLPLWAAVCPLPDLSQPDRAEAPVRFETVEDAAGVLRVRMSDPVAETETLLGADGETRAPARPLRSGLRWLYSEATGWLQVPRGWRVQHAAVGVDGSWIVRMDDGRQGVLEASSTGSCVGCALQAGSGWFPTLAEHAREMDIEPCTVFRPTPQRVPQGSTRIRFHYVVRGGMRHDGVVRQETGDDSEGAVLRILVAGLPPDLRDSVLQRF